jgi:adenylylsulfate kinase
VTSGLPIRGRSYRNLRLHGLESRRIVELHRGLAVWFTGLPSAGKTTIGKAAAQRLRSAGFRTELLDGDALRETLCKDLGFSRQDREENLRRISFVSELLARNGVIVLVAAITPYRAIREEIRSNSSNFLEVYVNAPLEVCEQRDVKGLYRKARNGEIHGLTGIDDVYEPPLDPEIECRTSEESLEDCVAKIVSHIMVRARRVPAHAKG